jgi:hypothetical protein
MHKMMRQWLAATWLLIALAACSSGKPQAQTEEDLHEIGPDAAEIGHPHVFLCSSMERLLVDFGADGLSLRIRRPHGGTPLVLTAPTQGSVFQGAELQATFKGQELQVAAKTGAVRTCRRQTKG